MNLRFKQKVDSGEFAFGVHCSSADPGFYEMSGSIGYDYVWIDTEHNPMTLPSVMNAIIATQAGGASAIVRVPECNSILAKPYLDMGADGIIFPMVNTPEQAEIAVRSCKYPPDGNRGYGPIRANDYGAITPEEYVRISNNNVIPIIQIEHVNAVLYLDEILSVKGVEFIVIGHMDLSASLGKAGQIKDPEVYKMILSIIQKCKERGIKFGMSLGVNAELYSFGRENGASFISVGNPYSFFKYATENFIKEAD